MAPSCAVVDHASLKARDCRVCWIWICAAARRDMVRLLRLALKRFCFTGPVGLACCSLATLEALEDRRRGQASPGPFDIHEHRAHLPHCVSYQEYGFHLGLCVPARFIQVRAGATFILCRRRRKVCGRLAVKCQTAVQAGDPVLQLAAFWAWWQATPLTGAGEQSAQLNFAHINQSHISSYQPVCLSAGLAGSHNEFRWFYTEGLSLLNINSACWKMNKHKPYIFALILMLKTEFLFQPSGCFFLKDISDLTYQQKAKKSNCLHQFLHLWYKIMPCPCVTLCTWLSVTAPVFQLCMKHQNLSFRGKFKSKWPSVYVLSCFFSSRLPLGASEGGRGLAREWGVSERVKACGQTVGESFALLFVHTGAYNLQPVINHCCVWGWHLG